MKIQSFINKYVLTFLGSDDNIQKTWYVIQMCRGLLERLDGSSRFTDTDDLQYKVITTPALMMGYMIQETFFACYRKFAMTLRRRFNPVVSEERTERVGGRNKKPKLSSDINEIWEMCFRPFTTKIESTMKSSSPWAKFLTNPMRLVRRTTNHMQFVNSLLRIYLPVNKETPQYELRQVHGSCLGYVDNSNTSENSNIGLNMQPGITCTITTEPLDMNRQLEFMLRKLVVPKTDGRDILLQQKNLLYFNQKVLGKINGPIQDCLRACLRIKRHTYRFLSVYILPNYGGVALDSSEGRFIRPLWVVENKRKGGWENLQTFEELEQGEFIEWLDVREQNACFLASSEEDVITPKHIHCTHQNLADWAGFSCDTASIPFLNHDKAARNQLGAGQRNHGCGVPFLDPKKFSGEFNFHLNYPQRSLAGTQSDAVSGYDSQPTTTNVVCMIYTTPDNMEDAVGHNKSFSQRGGQSLTIARTYTFIVEKPSLIGLVGSPPTPDIDPDGLIAIGSEVKTRSILATKIKPTEDGNYVSSGVIHLSDVINVAEYANSFRVTKIVKSMDPQGRQILQVTISRLHGIDDGDKGNSGHGQKGDFGQSTAAIDLPFAMESGIIPDLIINPHFMPSRMTVSSFIEGNFNKVLSVSCLKGNDIPGLNPTAFLKFDKEKLLGLMNQHGVSEMEWCINGQTGKLIRRQVAILVLACERLCHFSALKKQSSDYASISLETRQVTKGRAQQGGNRQGEMETHAKISHGCALTLHNKLTKCSGDSVTVRQCVLCHKFSLPESPRCMHCLEELTRKPFNIPYSTLIMQRNLDGANIKIDIIFEKDV